jgi:predicted transcriptional regulator
MMYLKAYHEKAFADRPKPAFAISPEQTFMGQDHLRCMIDGEPMVFLTRHIQRKHGMSFDAYLDHCGLPPDYPSRALYSSTFDPRNMTVYARPHFQQGDNAVRPLTI